MRPSENRTIHALSVKLATVVEVQKNSSVAPENTDVSMDCLARE
jgi:hypothetical protein